MSKVIIIAEAGVNHNGDLNIAKQLIDVAADAGVDYVKFQTFRADTIVSPQAKKADYQSKNTGNEEQSQYDMLKALELSEADHEELIDYCKSRGVEFLSSAFDVQGIEYLNELNLGIFKIPSGEITNYPYLKAIALTGKPIVLSTGMADMKDIEDALLLLEENGVNRDQITVLHCNTEYPTPMHDVNLHAMNTIKNAFDVKVGYSDHTLGIEVSVAAVALGAKLIEKHFTLDHSLPGPDHKASLEPDQLKHMVLSIRNIEAALSGDGIKRPSESEKKNVEIARKSIHLAKDLKKGTIIQESDIVPLRPGDGISAMEWNTIIGKVVIRDMNKFDKLNWSDIT
ncbi:N-acetylneuraminate synthase [Psychroserpens sp.]|uniref:N-acetylneuraminate synthase n=1 Tax=Psychroserpens sp. TaxID=2020870 RepID=UPI001B1DFF26|nr:N-acetylneuraminate synthase [Psychroserpens sp.]MBO6605874.1 N-acetylneuraminate synthase [Psychroserpens sp.]MBO6632106.1 N-acetylneuraminate synthase [Psychroserpens sp.]MBO6652755.1 N-acetylneuraminate synthase [Psychroserpens sp.]MBO6681473.1 N-acetylneuraminate synthase [Psychroserpens sp.]MBO6749248.1 N-acetylneuraminate synthase [Psychroserpens sp.]